MTTRFTYDIQTQQLVYAIVDKDGVCKYLTTSITDAIKLTQLNWEMTITANQLLNLFTKANKLGYSYSFDGDESGGYEIEIYWYDNEEKQVMNLYIDKKSDDFYNCSYDEFNDVMRKMDKEFYELMHDKEKQERFEMYQKLQKEFGKNWIQRINLTHSTQLKWKTLISFKLLWLLELLLFSYLLLLLVQVG